MLRNDALNDTDHYLSGTARSRQAISGDRTRVVTAELGHRVYFTTAIDLARKLTRAMNENRLSREMKNLTRPKLLIVDEVGYLKLEQPEASLVFQTISQRYERPGAMILTSNKAFSWSCCATEQVGCAQSS